MLGDRLHETPVIAELLADDILAMALERAGLRTPPIVPYEASAALAMLLLRDYGIITVHLLVCRGPQHSCSSLLHPKYEAVWWGSDVCAGH